VGDVAIPCGVEGIRTTAVEPFHTRRRHLATN
jgi:hypothetical protein